MPLAYRYISVPNVQLFVRLERHEAVEIKRRASQLQVEKDPNGMRQDFIAAPRRDSHEPS